MEQVSQAHAAIFRFGMPLPAIHRDSVSPSRQPGRKFFGEGLKSTVVRGDAACSEKSEPHGAENRSRR